MKSATMRTEAEVQSIFDRLLNLNKRLNAIAVKGPRFLKDLPLKDTLSTVGTLEMLAEGVQQYTPSLAYVLDKQGESDPAAGLLTLPEWLAHGEEVVSHVEELQSHVKGGPSDILDMLRELVEKRRNK